MLTPNKVRQDRRIPSSECRSAEVVEIVTDISSFILLLFRHQPIFPLSAKKKHEKVRRKSHHSGAYRLASLISGLMFLWGTYAQHTVPTLDRYPRNRACQISTAFLCLLRPLHPNAQVSGNNLAGARGYASMVQHISLGQGLWVDPWTVRY